MKQRFICVPPVPPDVPSLEAKGKIVDVSTLSLALPQSEKTRMWVKLFKSIDRGKAFVTTEKTIGVSRGTVRSKLLEFQKKGWAPKGLRVSYRVRKDGDIDIFIINDIGLTKEQKGGVE
jgi:hypothetical protein